MFVYRIETGQIINLDYVTDMKIKQHGSVMTILFVKFENGNIDWDFDSKSQIEEVMSDIEKGFIDNKKFIKILQ